MQYTSYTKMFLFIFVITLSAQLLLLYYTFNLSTLKNNIILLGGYALNVSLTISMLALGAARVKSIRLKKLQERNQ